MATLLNHRPTSIQNNRPPLSGLWLEITGKCNLRCTHCYADSQPTGSHGVLTRSEWEHIITEAGELGVETIQFIGGEPTLHPDFAALVRFAADTGVDIEVYTNLLRVPQWMWQLFEDCHVSLATSFYSAQAEIHDRVTTRHGSQRRTLANIQEALLRGFPLRVGIISIFSDQDLTETEQMLRSIGVTNVGVDRVRGVGRGATYDRPTDSVETLCGACSSSRAAVDPNGWVYPCVFSRWLKIGNVRESDFADVIRGEAMRSIRDELDEAFSHRASESLDVDHPIQSGLERCPPGVPNCYPIQMCPPVRRPGPCMPGCTPPCGPIRPQPPIPQPISPSQ